MPSQEKMEEIAKETDSTLVYVKMLLRSGFKIEKEGLRELYITHLNKEKYQNPIKR